MSVRAPRRIPLVVAAAAVTVLAGGAVAAKMAAATAAPEPTAVIGGWSETWGTAQSAAVPNVPTGFAGFTIRNVVHTSIPGTQVRVHLSNRYGTAPVLMAHVTVAVSAHTGGRANGTIDNSDGTARAGTMRDVRFAGNAAITIPAGAEVVSDGVGLAVPADSDLLVSTWTPNPSGTVSFHSAAKQTSFFNDDRVDHAADTTAASVPKQTFVWHYASGVDVSGGNGTVVALGDSITDGVNSTSGANRRWPDFLSQRLNGQFGPLAPGVVNAGISGNRVILDGSAPNYTIFDGSSRSALARLTFDVLDRPGVRSVIVFEGINDIQQTPHQTDPQQILAGLAQVAAQAHARGLRVIGATMTAWSGWNSFTPALEQVRQTVNTWIRTSGAGAFDGLADFDAAIRNPANPQVMLPAFDSGDHLHPNDAGDRAMANAVFLAQL
jgi:lysophospholipase L1-like esterase